MDVKTKNKNSRMERVASNLSKDPRQLALAINLKDLHPNLTFAKSSIYAAIKALFLRTNKKQAKEKAG